MNRKLAICGLVLIIAGALFLASAWVSSNIYGSTVDIIVYSPWLDWGLIVIGDILIFIAIFMVRES